MERAVWIFACIGALSFAYSISSLSTDQNNQFEIKACEPTSFCTKKSQLLEKGRSEKFLRTIKRKPRTALV
jgi:hypothetical protein